VSLFVPNDLTGIDKSFSEIFEVADRPPMVKEILQDMQPMTEELEAVFLKPRLPDENTCHPGAVLSVFNGCDSMWIQFDEERNMAARISMEMARFYKNGACDETTKINFAENMKVGMFVAVDSVEDKLWYRAKILKIEGKQLLLHYIDFGNVDCLECAAVFPLHSYFAKDHILALEVGLR